jgi:hypothetical protein
MSQTQHPPTGAAAALPMRLAIGFVAGFLSVLTFQMGTIAILQAVGVAVPITPWSMAPVPPFGVPQSFSGAFWGGLWGIVYALLEPKLTAWLGWLAGGVVFGAVLPVLVLWFIVLPLKGMPVGGGFTLPGVLMSLLFHAAFGLGVAVLFRLGLHLGGGRPSGSPAGLSDE